MVARVLVLLVALAALGGAPADARHLGDCEKKVPPEADRVFDRVAAAFRKRSAAGVAETVDPSKGGRVYLALAGIDPGAYTKDQATELLAKPYFEKHAVTAIAPAEGCTTGDDTRLTRTYRVTLEVDGRAAEASLTVTIHRKKVDETTAAWFLGSLKDG